MPGARGSRTTHRAEPPRRPGQDATPGFSKDQTVSLTLTSSCHTWGSLTLRGPHSPLIQRQSIAGCFVAGLRRPCRKPGRSISCFQRVLVMTAWRRSSPCWGFPSPLRRPFLSTVGLFFVPLQVLMCSPQWWVAVAGLEESSLPFPGPHQALPGLLHLYSLVAHKFCRACGASEEQPSLGTGFPQPRVVSGHWP